MGTIQTELVAERPPVLPIVEATPGTSYTLQPAFADAEDVIARVSAAMMEQILLAEGYLEMRSDLVGWSEVSFVAQAEILPDE